MRKWLLPLLSFTIFAGPVQAAVIQAGGDLSVEIREPLEPSASFATDSIVSAYSNISTFLGRGYYAGIFDFVSADSIGTPLVADDLTPLPADGGADVTSFKFTTANNAPGTVTFRPRVRFYLADGAGGAPGTLAGGFDFNPVTMPGNSIETLTAILSPGTMSMFGVPFWAGVAFDNDHGQLTVSGQLVYLGQGLYDPPRVGSSTDEIYISNNMAFDVDDPPGALVSSYGTGPYNLGWEFDVDQMTPALTTTWGRLKSLYR